MVQLKNQVITRVGKDVKKSEPSNSAGRNIKWCSYFWKTKQFLKKSTTELPFDPAIPLLGMDPKEMKA